MVAEGVKISSDVAHAFISGVNKEVKVNYQKAYKQWLCSRRTILEICLDLDVSYPKLTKEFDRLDTYEVLQEGAWEDISKSINLLIDATFFGREYGFLVFHDCEQVIYFKEVKTRIS